MSFTQWDDFQIPIDAQLVPYTPTYMQYPGCRWDIDPRGFLLDVEDLVDRLLPEEKI